MVEVGLRSQCPRVPDQRLGNDGSVFSLIVAEIRADGSRPIDVGVTRATCPLRTIERPAKSLLGFMLQPGHKVVWSIQRMLLDAIGIVESRVRVRGLADVYRLMSSSPGPELG
jgi:hypothetical protein